jgi:hypothetical protein
VAQDSFLRPQSSLVAGGRNIPPFIVLPVEMHRPRKMTSRDPCGGNTFYSSTWIRCLFLCSMSLQSRHCQAFLHDQSITSPQRPSPRPRFRATVEKEVTEEVVETRSSPSHTVMKESDYQDKFVNVTGTPFLVDESSSSSSSSSPPPGPSSERSVVDKTRKRRSLWGRRKNNRRRDAEKGIRRAKLPQLSSLLERAGAMEHNTHSSTRRHYAARTISGLIHALAEEAIDLEVKVDARSDTPLWEKEVNEVRINFSKLSFKPLRIGGVNTTQAWMEEKEEEEELGGDDQNGRVVVVPGIVDDSDAKESESEEIIMPFLDLSSADESFRRIDVDNSGALDRDEIVRALNMAAGCLEEDPDEPRSMVIQNIANELFDLYDFNGDGVVDRNEYQSLVEDMAALTTTQGERQSNESSSWFSTLFTATKNYATNIFRSTKSSDVDSKIAASNESSLVAMVNEPVQDTPGTLSLASMDATVVDVSESARDMGSVAKSFGSITLEGLKLDLRRLAFGVVPLLKHITPGGPLILEPFTMHVVGSFSSSDIMNSPLLNAGLQQLVALVLRRRMRSFRDLLDLSVLKGRDWTMASKMAPVTKVTELSSVEFDSNNKMIITGRAKIRTRPGAPTIDQAFKVRVNAGTRQDGRFIRLVEPELAFVLECPRPIEEG